jgi:hypothetical protein
VHSRRPLIACSYGSDDDGHWQVSVCAEAAAVAITLGGSAATVEAVAFAGFVMLDSSS